MISHHDTPWSFPSHIITRLPRCPLLRRKQVYWLLGQERLETDWSPGPHYNNYWTIHHNQTVSQPINKTDWDMCHPCATCLSSPLWLPWHLIRILLFLSGRAIFYIGMSPPTKDCVQLFQMLSQLSLMSVYLIFYREILKLKPFPWREFLLTSY